ncbi:MAG: YeeE/YedE thiosulfate transporter family protein, partial [Alphaproteobacteria bacterium]
VFGWNPATAPFWTGRFTSTALGRDLWHDVTSVMNAGIILGALMAAGLAGRFSPVPRIPPKSLLAAVVGGLAMGYGARIAFGCNIGAFFSGVASTSLHGWLWIVFALGGTWAGVRLRPLFGLAR